MNIHSIRTTTDMLRTAADALRHDEDPTRLMTLQDINQGWMQTDDERDAMHDLLQAMIEAQENMPLPPKAAAPEPKPTRPEDRILTIEEFRASATEMTPTDAAERIGVYADCCWEPDDTVLVYEQDAWIVRRADGSHWLLIEHSDWAEPREQLEQRLYDWLFAPV